METLIEIHGSSRVAILRYDGAGPSNTTQMPSNQCQLQFQVERTEREALARHIKHLEDELNHVKGMLATVIESSLTVEQNQPPPLQNLEQNQSPIQSQPPEDVEQNQLSIPREKTSTVDLPSSPSKAVKRGKLAKKKAKVAMVDLTSSPSKRDKRGRPANNKEEAAAAMVDLASSPSKLAKKGRPAKNEGEATMVDLASSPSKEAMVDLVSSPSKGVTFVRYARGKTRAQKNVMIVPPESEPVRNEVRVLFNNKVLKKCKFTLCWVYALTFFLFKNHKIFNSS
jgi:hypothetical protein